MLDNLLFVTWFLFPALFPEEMHEKKNSIQRVQKNYIGGGGARITTFFFLLDLPAKLRSSDPIVRKFEHEIVF